MWKYMHCNNVSAGELIDADLANMLPPLAGYDARILDRLSTMRRRVLKLCRSRCMQHAQSLFTSGSHVGTTATHSLKHCLAPLVATDGCIEPGRMGGLDRPKSSYSSRFLRHPLRY
jgi:hypothetical protein